MYATYDRQLSMYSYEYLQNLQQTCNNVISRAKHRYKSMARILVELFET